ncbi:hypothetical protein G6F22_015873 [Rhizopus arrhizus]|nr:hypothetical protein G6F22_015873 [Rhizopus arrhizus]
MLQPPGPRHQVQPVTHQPTVAPDPRGVGHQPAALPLPAVGALRDQRCARGRQCPQFEASISAEHLDLGPCVLAQRVTSTPALHGASRECFRLQTIQALRIAKTCNLRHQFPNLPEQRVRQNHGALLRNELRFASHNRRNNVFSYRHLPGSRNRVHIQRLESSAVPNETCHAGSGSPAGPDFGKRPDR